MTSNTDKHEFRSVWKSISCSHVMNHVDGVIKRDVYPPKLPTCSKHIGGILSFCSESIRCTCISRKRYRG